MYKIILMIVAGFLFSSGCVSSDSKRSESVPAPVVQPEKPPTLEENELYQKGVSQLKRSQATQAGQTFEQFLKKYPNSSLRLAVQIKQAQVLFAQSKWSEGTAELQKIIQSGIANPEISAEALYQISFGYEALGNDGQMLASLKDVESIQRYLPEDVAQIELPARLGIAYIKLGQVEEGKLYFKKTDEQIAKFRFKFRDLGDFDFSQTYFRIGRVQTHAISMENYQLMGDALAVGQKYSLRAMEKEGPWGIEARKALQENYMDVWNFCQSPPDIQALDIAASKRARQDLQVRWLSNLLQLIEFANLEMGSLDVRKDGELAQFQSFLKELEYKANLIVYSSEELTPLTPEAQKRSQLKKTFKSHEVSPSMKVIPDEEEEDADSSQETTNDNKAEPQDQQAAPVKANSEDPNL